MKAILFDRFPLLFLFLVAAFGSKSAQGWRTAVINAKAQHEHQSDRLLNLEVCEPVLADTYIRFNRSLEQSAAAMKHSVDKVSKQVNQVNSERKRKQDGARVELDKLLRRRDEATLKCWQITESLRSFERQLGEKFVERARLEVEAEEDRDRAKRQRGPQPEIEGAEDDVAIEVEDVEDNNE